MLNFLNDIITIGKKLRSKVLFDIYDNIDYLSFMKSSHLKKMCLKNLIKSKTFYK